MEQHLLFVSSICAHVVEGLFPSDGSAPFPDMARRRRSSARMRGRLRDLRDDSLAQPTAKGCGAGRGGGEAIGARRGRQREDARCRSLLIHDGGPSRINRSLSAAAGHSLLRENRRIRLGREERGKGIAAGDVRSELKCGLRMNHHKFMLPFRVKYLIKRSKF